MFSALRGMCTSFLLLGEDLSAMYTFKNTPFVLEFSTTCWWGFINDVYFQKHSIHTGVLYCIVLEHWNSYQFVVEVVPSLEQEVGAGEVRGTLQTAETWTWWRCGLQIKPNLSGTLLISCVQKHIGQSSGHGREGCCQFVHTYRENAAAEQSGSVKGSASTGPDGSQPLPAFSKTARWRKTQYRLPSTVYPSFPLLSLHTSLSLSLPTNTQ